MLELALKEASSLGHRNVEGEHILLGLLREREGVANQILDWYGATADKVRNEVVQSLAAVPAVRDVREDHSGRGFTAIRTGIGLWPLAAAALGFAAGVGILLGWLTWG